MSFIVADRERVATVTSEEPFSEVPYLDCVPGTESHGTRNERIERSLLILVCLHIVLALVYWTRTPYGLPPDEVAHGTYVRTLADTQKLPVWEGPLGSGYEFHHGPLYYVLAVPFCKLGSLTGLKKPAAMARLASVILGGLLVFVTYHTIRSGFPSHKDLPLACAAFVGLLPTQVMESSSVNNDVLMELVFALALLVTTQILRRGISWRKTTTLGTLIGMGLLTKATCLALLPVALVTYYLIWRRKKSATKEILGHIGIIISISMFIAGWWLIRNQVLYGVPFPQFYLQSPKFAHRLSSGCSVRIYVAEVIMCAFASFWAAFGHTTVFMPHWAYYMLAFLVMLAIAGCFAGVRELRSESPCSRDVICLHGWALFVVLMAFAKLNTMCFLAQGRYLLGALVPISLFWATGIRGLLPLSHVRLSPYIAAAIPFIVQIIAFVSCVLPLAR